LIKFNFKAEYFDLMAAEVRHARAALLSYEYVFLHITGDTRKAPKAESFLKADNIFNDCNN